VIVEDRRAVGIKLEDGTEHRGDYVISAADGYATIFEMLEGKYLDKRTRATTRNWPSSRPWSTWR